MFLTWVEFADLVWGEEWRLFRTGPVLHELMHRWANNILPTSYGGHWGFSSAAGVVGGFGITNLVDRGGGQYTAGSWGGVAGPNKPAHFSSIELYLAGVVPPAEVPDLWVAEDGEWLYDEGSRVFTDNGPIFTAISSRSIRLRISSPSMVHVYLTLPSLRRISERRSFY